MRIGIRKAHTKKSTGAVGFLNEWEESRNLFPKVVELLKPYHCIIDCTPDENIGWGEWSKGVNIANSSNLDLFFSLHFNSGSGDPRGVEVCVYPTDIAAASYGAKVCENIAKLGFRNRGVKNRSDLAETCNIKCPSMVIETAFVQESDGKLYKEVGVDKIARAIANAIDSRIPLEEPVKAPVVESKPVTQELYRVRLDWHNVQSQRGAYSNLTNAIAECKKYIGYKVYDSKGKQVYPEEAIQYSTKLIKNYKEVGRATVTGTDKVNIRNSYKIEENKIADVYYKNESFNYDSVYITEYKGVQYIWCSYVSLSGVRRYVCAKEGNTRYLTCV